MKKNILCYSLLVVLVSVMMFSACEFQQESTESQTLSDQQVPTENKSEEKEIEVVDFAEIYGNINWEDSVITYTQPVVPDQETAVAIAKAIFAGMEKSEAEKQFVPQIVSFDEKNEIWFVSFWEENVSDENGAVTLGHDCSIAIQKSDGKVLRIWFGE